MLLGGYLCGTWMFSLMPEAYYSFTGGVDWFRVGGCLLLQDCVQYVPVATPCRAGTYFACVPGMQCTGLNTRFRPKCTSGHTNHITALPIHECLTRQWLSRRLTPGCLTLPCGMQVQRFPCRYFSHDFGPSLPNCQPHRLQCLDLHGVWLAVCRPHLFVTLARTPVSHASSLQVR